MEMFIKEWINERKKLRQKRKDAILFKKYSNSMNYKYKATNELTEEILKNTNPNDIIAITLSEPGAMGEKCAFYMVNKHLDRFHVNMANNNWFDLIVEVFPFLKEASFIVCQVFDLDEKWKWFDMGFGNYLLIRSEYYDEYKKIIDDSFKGFYDEFNKTVLLYRAWYEFLNRLFDKSTEVN